jgi:hypothetical protein
MPSTASDEERPVVFETNAGPSKDDKTTTHRNRDEKKEVRQGAKRPDKTTTVPAQKRKPGMMHVWVSCHLSNNKIFNSF